MSFLCGQASLALVLLALADVAGLGVSFLAGVALVFLTGTIFESVGTLARTSVLVGQVGQAARRVVDIADQDRDSGEQGCAAPEGGDIVLSNVNFRWNDTQPLVLRGLSMTIRSGEHVALIGFGSG
nr:hypothetical protein [Asaia astilbis]